MWTNLVKITDESCFKYRAVSQRDEKNTAKFDSNSLISQIVQAKKKSIKISSPKEKKKKVIF